MWGWHEQIVRVFFRVKSLLFLSFADPPNSFAAQLLPTAQWKAPTHINRQIKRKEVELWVGRLQHIWSMRTLSWRMCKVCDQRCVSNMFGFFSCPLTLNVWSGSTAGAGSGEFHVYRHQRRKEFARIAQMEREAKEVRLQPLAYTHASLFSHHTYHTHHTHTLIRMCTHIFNRLRSHTFHICTHLSLHLCVAPTNSHVLLKAEEKAAFEERKREREEKSEKKTSKNAKKRQKMKAKEVH